MSTLFILFNIIKDLQAYPPGLGRGFIYPESDGIDPPPPQILFMLLGGVVLSNMHVRYFSFKKGTPLPPIFSQPVCVRLAHRNPPFMVPVEILFTG